MESFSFRRRKLPHWRVFGQPYFITIRIHGTIPCKVLSELKQKLDKMRAQEEDEIKIQRWQFKKIESILDTCSGYKNFLNVPDVGNMVLNELKNLELKITSEGIEKFTIEEYDPNKKEEKPIETPKSKPVKAKKPIKEPTTTLEKLMVD